MDDVDLLLLIGAEKILRICCPYPCKAWDDFPWYLLEEIFSVAKGGGEFGGVFLHERSSRDISMEASLGVLALPTL